MNRYQFVTEAATPQKVAKKKVVKKVAKKKVVKRKSTYAQTLAERTMRTAANTRSHRVDIRRGMRVCFTGTGPEPRARLQDRLRWAGLLYTSNASRAHILVYNPDQVNRQTVKFTTAVNDPGVFVLTYEDFLSRI